MNGARHQFLACTSLASNQNSGLGRGNPGNARNHLFQSLRRSDNLLEHRSPIDFFAQQNVLVLKPLLSHLPVVDIGSRPIPTRDAPMLIHHRAKAVLEPTILTVPSSQPHLDLERRSFQEFARNFKNSEVRVLRMNQTTCIGTLLPGFESKTEVLESGVVVVDAIAIGPQ